MLNGKQFRFGGANIYWLGLYSNIGNVHYATDFQIKDALQTAADMGVTVVRSHTLGISVGNPLSVEPKLGQFNAKAFDTIDYSIYEAHKLGIRLIIPLTDNWHYYEGSYHTFTQWLGLPSSDFYTSPKAIAAFEQYISHLLNHVNPYTKLAYKNDPTVMAWELGNELNGMTPSWIEKISSFIHNLAPHQLIAAGQQYGVNPATLTAPDVNIVDCHYYPPLETDSFIESNAAQVAKAGKVFIAGEYGSIVASKSLLAPLVSDKNISGAAFWSLFAHRNTYGYDQHNDGETLHFPGVSSAMRSRDHAIRDFDYAMNQPVPDRAALEVRGLGVPPEPPPGQPLITSIQQKNGLNVIAWRGTTDALHYSIERSSNATGPWTLVCSKCATDDQTPWTDKTSLATPSYYRVIPYNADGIVGIPSPPVLSP